MYPIKYDTPIFRPPSEAYSLLIQITIGCSNNCCTYCDMYRSKKFRVRTLAEIKNDIDSAVNYYGSNYPTKIFLCDGDGLAAPIDLLISTLDYLNKCFPKIRRIGIYATARNILDKSEDDLQKLKDRNLSIFYLGLESGSDQVLKLVAKKNSAHDMVEASLKAKKAKIQLSVIAMLGLGGRELSKEHCRDTAIIVSKIAPDFFSFLTTVPINGTPYAKQIEKGDIDQLTSKELMEEMGAIIANINCTSNVIFRANHVSNQYPLAGTFPRDKKRLMTLVNEWIDQTPSGIYPTFPLML